MRRTAVGAGGFGDWRPILRWVGIGLAGYSVYRALKAGKLTPHAVLAVASLLASLG